MKLGADKYKRSIDERTLVVNECINKLLMHPLCKAHGYSGYKRRLARLYQPPMSAPPTEEACSTQVEVEQREVNKEIIQLQQ